MCRTKFYLVSILLVFISISVFSQSSIAVKFGALGIHPFDKPYYLDYENNLTGDGTFNVEPLAILSYEAFFLEDYWSLDFTQGFVSDAGARSAGFTSVFVKRRVYRKWRNFIYASVGTTLSYRQTWNDYAYKGNDYWQMKPMLSAMIEYDFLLGDRSDLSVAAIYGHYNETFTFTIGYRFWINTIIRNPRNCECPFQNHQYRGKEKNK